jgi:hypothetical protein
MAKGLTMQQDVMKPYRIWHRSRPWWRRPWPRWQSENPDLCRFARRGFTPGRARQKMERDAHAALMGRRSLYQRWRWWRARKWDREHLGRP